MPELGDLWAKVAVTVITAGLVGLIGWLWTRRRKPLDWAAAGEKAVAHRRRRIEGARRAQLVQFVLQRAEVLKLAPGQDVPVKVTGRKPAMITFHPTGRTFALYPDLSSYRSAAERREINPTNAHFGKPPIAVSRWSEEQLRAWLRAHADQLPAETG